MLYFGNPASPSGGRLDFDSNAGCANPRTSPVENVFWQTGQAPRGNYVYWAQHFGCGPASAFTLQVLRGTTVVATQTGNLNPGGQSQQFSLALTSSAPTASQNLNRMPNDGRNGTLAVGSWMSRGWSAPGLYSSDGWYAPTFLRLRTLIASR